MRAVLAANCTATGQDGRCATAIHFFSSRAYSTKKRKKRKKETDQRKKRSDAGAKQRRKRRRRGRRARTTRAHQKVVGQRLQRESRLHPLRQLEVAAEAAAAVALPRRQVVPLMGSHNR
jgi:hypothetical protein